MFTKVENLDPAKHRDLRFKPAVDFGFAAALASVPISVTEIVEISRYYPIAFSGESPLLPVALLSLEEGRNFYLDGEGKWIVPYIPAHVRRYPFILGATDQPEKFTVMADMDAPHFSSAEGEPLYDENGNKSPALQHATNFLSLYQQELAATQKLLEPLTASGIITTQRIDMTGADGQKASFEGIHSIDQKKMLELDDATLAGWVRNGLMGVVYAHGSSLKNLNLLAELQKQKAQAKPPPKKEPEPQPKPEPSSDPF